MRTNACSGLSEALLARWGANTVNCGSCQLSYSVQAQTVLDTCVEASVNLSPDIAVSAAWPMQGRCAVPDARNAGGTCVLLVAVASQR
jgi:hypothetical protein